VKTTTVIYCFDNNSGKVLADTIRDDYNSVLLCNASAFSTKEIEKCERVVIMPDVQARFRDLIEASYQGKIWPAVVSSPKTITAPIEIQKPEEPTQVGVSKLRAKHCGHGKFYVMRGDEIISGPHTNDEALRLTA
jgi:hypothetical protein